jgi:hypothetical protein
LIRHTRLRLLARRFEGDPLAQYIWHKWAMRFWAASTVAVVAVFIFAPDIWARGSVLYLVLISQYAAWGLDFGAMSSAEAAAKGPVSAFSVDAETDTIT